jgi:DNA-directed RNA polymerase II subunit RPB1
MAEIRRLPRGQRLKRAEANAATDPGKSCPHCGQVQPKIEKSPDDYISLRIETVKASSGRGSKAVTSSRLFMPGEIRSVLERLDPALVEDLTPDLRQHPRNLLVSCPTVPTTQVRPKVRIPSLPAADAYDAPTTYFARIIQANHLVTADGSAGPLDDDQEKRLLGMGDLYFAVLKGATATGAGAKKRAVVTTLGQTNTSLLARQKRKFGRIRRDCLGARTWLLCRNTISGNPDLKPTQVAIPLAFARAARVEEPVTPANLERLTAMFLRRDPGAYPRCHGVYRRETGRYHTVDRLPESVFLEVGDRVIREAIDGDVVIFSRPPSLERSSITALQAVILMNPIDTTFQMNVIICSLFNADFDGDAMILSVLSGINAVAQSQVLSYVHEMMISAKDSSPVITPVQDGVLGAALLSKSAALYTAQEAQAILADARLHGRAVTEVLRRYVKGGETEPTVPGRALWSAVLRGTPLNYSRGCSTKGKAISMWLPARPDEETVRIVRGELKAGILDKKAVGSSAGGLPALAVQAYGASKALQFVDQAQRLAIGGLDRSGISIGLGDILVTRGRRNAIRQSVRKTIAKSRSIADELKAGAVVPPIGTSMKDHYENLQAATLQPSDEVVGQVVGGMAPDSNCLKEMVASASKGKVANLTNIQGSVGQATINGKRAKESLGGRTFPYSPRFSLDPEDHGWISECYTDGISSMPTLFNAMSGRFDLTTKALTTAETGHLMRKSVMSLQGNIAGSTFSSGQAGGIVHSPLYGGDGFETRWLESVKFPTSTASDASVQKSFAYAAIDEKFRAQAERADKAATELAAKHLKDLLALRARYRRSFGRAAAADRSRAFSDKKLAPVNVMEIVSDVFVQSGDEKGEGGATEPETFAARLTEVDNFVRDVPYLYQNEGRRRSQARLPSYLIAAAFLTQYQVREVLAPPTVARLTPKGLDYVLKETAHRFRRAFIPPGMTVGILAAQAVGEPLTQYMLDSHHRSVEGGSSSAGLDEIKEVYNVVSIEREASPSMTIVPAAGASDPAAAAERLAALTQQLNMRRVLVRYDLLYDQYPQVTYPAFSEDQEWIDEQARMGPGPPPGDLTRFCARVVFDPNALVLKGVSLEDIVLACSAHTGATAMYVHSAGRAKGGASGAFVLRIWWREGAFAKRRTRKTPLQQEAMNLLEALLDHPIRGVSGVDNTAVENYYPRWGEKEDGSFGPLPPTPVVTTTGTNLLDAAGLPGIDLALLETSSLRETLRTFGIEAARHRIIQRFLGFLGDSAPDLRHIEQFADLMTQTGGLTAINRSGMTAREPHNVLGQMAMGVPAESLYKAVKRGATSEVTTPAAALMTGQLPRIGTSFFDVGVDPELAKTMKVTTQAFLDDLDDLSDLAFLDEM